MEDIFGILQLTLSSYLMLALWSSVVLLSAYMAIKTGIVSMGIIGGGTTPWVIFHVFKMAGVWIYNPEIAIFYSRVAQVALAVSIIASLLLMLRSRYRAKP